MAEFEYTTDDVVDDVEPSYEDYTEDEAWEQLSKAEMKIYKDLWIDLENASVDDLKKIAKRLINAEKVVVDKKKAEKQLKSNSAVNAITEEELALREEISEFLSENKDLKEYKADLMKYAKKMLAEWDSMETAIRKAKALVENDDKTIENRRKTQSMNLTDWDGGGSKNSYTQEEVAKLPRTERLKIWEKVHAWKITVK